MVVLGFVLLIIGILLILYSRVINIRNSTAKAMADVALKKLASIFGGLLSIIGLIILLAGCAA